MKTIIFLAALGCCSLAIPLEPTTFQQVPSERIYHGYGTQDQMVLRTNPWLLRKYQTQMEQKQERQMMKTFGKYTVEYLEQFEELDRNLHIMRDYLERIEKTGDFNQELFMRHVEVVKAMFDQLHQLKNILEHYLRTGQEIPVEFTLKVKELNQHFLDFQREFQTTYHFDLTHEQILTLPRIFERWERFLYIFQERLRNLEMMRPLKMTNEQRMTYIEMVRDLFTQLHELKEHHQHYLKVRQQFPTEFFDKLRRFQMQIITLQFEMNDLFHMEYQRTNEQGQYTFGKTIIKPEERINKMPMNEFSLKMNTPFKTIQKTLQWRQHVETPEDRKEFMPIEQTRRDLTYQKVNQPMRFSQTKRERQIRAGYLANQWDEDFSEQGTFDDLIRHFTKKTQTEKLQRIDESTNIRFEEDEIIIEDTEILKRQQQVLRMIRNIHQSTIDPEIMEIGNKYSIQENIEKYDDMHAVQNFMKQYERGFLPKEAIFSIFNPEHVKQVLTMFKLFYHAKDWETFMNTAAWSRIHLNEDMFNYIFTVSLIQRTSTDLLVLPPSYMINPIYFINEYYIQRAQNIKQTLPEKTTETLFILNNTYPAWYLNLHPEQHLSYFTDDVALNNFYYMYHINFPFWLNSEYLKLGGERRGEQSYYLIQQLLARYRLERLSNNMGDIPEFDLDEGSIETGYYPSLRYHNGLEFPSRPSHVDLGKNELIDELELMINRIRDAIDAGFIIDEQGKRIELRGEDGLEILLNIIESTPESRNPQFYGALNMIMRWILGYSPEPYNHNKLVPSALEHFETTLRDPVAWQSFQKIIDLMQRYKSQLPSYSRQQLVFPGVTVEDLTVDRLVTFFEDSDIDITNAVYINEREITEERVHFVARQARLNHKTFSVKLNVKSQQDQTAVVRIFLGPKYDEFGREINIHENRMNFFEMDKFQTQLRQGMNKIIRQSREMNAVQDFSNTFNFSKLTSEQGKTMRIPYSDLLTAFPERLLLPKGQHGGQTFQIYVIVTPFISQTAEKMSLKQEDLMTKGLLRQNVDDLPLGYPFDRIIDETIFLTIPNAVFQDVIIEHEGPEVFDAVSGNHRYQRMTKH